MVELNLFFPEIVMAILLGSMTTVYLYIYYKFYKPARLMFNLRSFFTIRDQFIFQLAKQEKRSHPLIDHYVTSINNVIKYAEHYHIDALITAIQKVNTEIANDENRKKITAQLKGAEPEIKRLVENYYESLMIFIVSNSSFGMILKVLLWGIGAITAYRIYFALMRILTIIRPSKREEVDVVSRLDSIRTQLSYA